MCHSLWIMHSNSPGDNTSPSTNVMIVNNSVAPVAFFRRDVNANSVVADETVDFVDEWSSPTRAPPRSRSWFCCANEARDTARQPNLRRRPMSCHYSIVRTEPKSQSEIVNLIIQYSDFCYFIFVFFFSFYF